MLQFLIQAVRVVIECRRILRWTYVHAYYIDSGAERTLFEYRQGELESLTEKLNKMTEGDTEQLSQQRMAVLNATQALTAYMEGMENDQVHKMVRRQDKAAESGEAEDEKAEAKDAKRKGKKATKAKKGKRAADEEEQWTTDAQGVIVRAKVEKGKKASKKKTAAEVDAQPNDDMPDEEDEADMNEAEGEEEEEEAEGVDAESGAEEEVVEDEAGEELEQQAILADIQSRSLSPTSVKAAAASSSKGSSTAQAEVIVLE